VTGVSPAKHQPAVAGIDDPGAPSAMAATGCGGQDARPTTVIVGIGDPGPA
jgi:hypothetical protein